MLLWIEFDAPWNILHDILSDFKTGHSHWIFFNFIVFAKNEIFVIFIGQATEVFCFADFFILL